MKLQEIFVRVIENAFLRALHPTPNDFRLGERGCAMFSSERLVTTAVLPLDRAKYAPRPCRRCKTPIAGARYIASWGVFVNSTGTIGLGAAFLIIAALYASVGQAGASGYL